MGMVSVFDDADTLAILEAVQASLDQGALLTYAYKYVARGWGVHEQTIAAIWKRHRSTAKLATMKIQAQASAIVEKIIEKAPTNELIDILSRPNIGVLEPMKSGNGGGGFIVSVSADSCGGVKVGVAGGFEPAALPAAPISSEHAPVDFHLLTEGETHEEDASPVQGHSGRSDAGEAIRARLAHAREQAATEQRRESHQSSHAGVKSVQGTLDPAPSRSLSSPGRTSKINLRYAHESFDESGV